ncbi:MAG: hypothetical protein PHY80_02365 [Rickettsiales bacterium]|nr:hypothetical protein [Rickettsiales bacterium]
MKSGFLQHFNLDFSKTNRLRIVFIFFIFFLTLQVLFWSKTENIKPNLGIVPEVPTIATVKSFSFGDEEFYFRLKGLRLQNAGDTYGRFSPLKNYDYKKLTAWFKLLDDLDGKSNYIPSLASYYYSMTQNTADLIYIINYLEQHADRDPEKKWWWYYQAMSLANNIYKDKDLAIRLAQKLKDKSPYDAPIWTKQMVALLLADEGQNCEAIKIISSIIEDYSKNDRKISDEELNFMRYFISKKIKELKEQNFDPANCK